LSRSETYPWHEGYGGECPGVYYIRLQRDGWMMKATQQHSPSDAVTAFEKAINDHWVLRKVAHATIDHPVGRGVYFDEHELLNFRTGEVQKFPAWEWAEIDGRRLIWAEGGKLFASRVAKAGLGVVSKIHDFNSMEFERVAAPY